MAKLILVGAGPGDPELISLKAIRALRSADVILYDALANEELLVHTQHTAIRQFVGKRFGCHALSQQEINHLIVAYGQQYGTIVRLKGGDPFVFGRAQEEIDAAVAAGMQVAVVPGISSALAVPASAMIPLTCRGINESFWVVTGTTQTGALSNDLHLAARSSATVVILMAMSRLEAIADLFIAAGKEETAAAIIQNGTSADAKMVTGSVKDIAFRAQREGLGNPAVIIIGAVVKLNRDHIKQMATGNITGTPVPVF
ncbi:MAG: uroporphyrinogen-III C-methyltransferase [Niabella sp.]|nr:uroporphyrinogen-III C-methyltransferase [Niabella sp.]